MMATLDRINDILMALLVILSLLAAYQRQQERGPLSGTLKQRLKCFFGFHDWRLLTLTTDPWRILWRCHWCQCECLTPDTHAKRAELDHQIPSLPERPATGKTVRL